MQAIPLDLGGEEPHKTSLWRSFVTRGVLIAIGVALVTITMLENHSILDESADELLRQICDRGAPRIDEKRAGGAVIARSNGASTPVRIARMLAPKE